MKEQFYLLQEGKVFNCELKTRSEMERDIPTDLLGWWHDVCPGKTLKLRQANASDIARCWLRSSASRNPADYMVELQDRGCLVYKPAIKKMWLSGLPAEQVSEAIAEIRARFELDA